MLTVTIIEQETTSKSDSKPIWRPRTSKLGKLRMAHIYAERAYGPVHSYDNRGNRYKLPLRLEDDEGAFPASYAEVLGVAAQISYAHGDVYEALAELHEAARLDPQNAENLYLYSQYTIRKEKLQQKQERRKKAQDRDAEIHYQRAAGT